jgi:hypothetical protein
MRFTVVAVTVLGLFGASCGGPPGILTVNELPATVTLQLGQDLRITSPDLLIRLLEIVEDSRCPVDVTCVQAGTVNLRFGVSVPGAPEGGFFMKLGESNSSLGVVLRVVTVTPERRTTVRLISPQDYRVSLGISAP